MVVIYIAVCKNVQNNAKSCDLFYTISYSIIQKAKRSISCTIILTPQNGSYMDKSDVRDQSLVDIYRILQIDLFLFKRLTFLTWKEPNLPYPD